MRGVHGVRVELLHLGPRPVQILNRFKERHEVHREGTLPSAGLRHGVKDGDVVGARTIAEDVAVTTCLAVVPLDFLHGTKAIEHILMTLFFQRSFKDRGVREEVIDGFRLIHGVKTGHRLCPFLRFKQRLERLGHHAGILSNVKRGEVEPKHPHLEHELADLVEVESIELRLHLLFQPAQSMQEHVLLQRQVAWIENGFLNHALQHVELPLQSFERDQATQLAEFLAVAAKQRELQLSGHPERGVSSHVGVAVSVSSRPKPNAQHAVVEAFTIRPTEGVGHARAEG